MHPISEAVLEKWQVRKTARQKAAFRAYLRDALAAEGVPVVEERKGASSGTVNLVAGDPARASVFFTAHYDTCARLLVPNFIAPTNLPLTLLYQLGLLIGVMLAAIVPSTLVGLLLLPVGVPPIAVGLLAGVLYFALFLLMVVGPANRHNANDNTSGVVVLLESMLSMPPAERARCCFVLFDNEEKGLLGAQMFRRLHPAAAERPLINFDCVSDGDHLLLTLSKKWREDAALTARVRHALIPPPGKTRHVLPASRALYPSDQIRYKKSVGVVALRHKRGLGLYLGRIHTARDTHFDRENIETLRRFAETFVRG